MTQLFWHLSQPCSHPSDDFRKDRPPRDSQHSGMSLRCFPVAKQETHDGCNWMEEGRQRLRRPKLRLGCGEWRDRLYLFHATYISICKQCFHVFHMRKTCSRDLTFSFLLMSHVSLILPCLCSFSQHVLSIFSIPQGCDCIDVQRHDHTSVSCMQISIVRLAVVKAGHCLGVKVQVLLR